jgi:hypothetical protein
MKDLLIGIILGALMVLMAQYFMEIKRLDNVKANKQHIIEVSI